MHLFEVQLFSVPHFQNRNHWRRLVPGGDRAQTRHGFDGAQSGLTTINDRNLPARALLRNRIRHSAAQFFSS
jgi:hypothetical protein